MQSHGELLTAKF